MAKRAKRTKKTGGAKRAGGPRAKRESGRGKLRRVAGAGEIPEGAAKAVRVGRREIAVFHLGGKFYALDNFCSHAGRTVSFSRASRCDEELLCPLHGWKFDVIAGKCSMVPDAKVRTYEVEVREDGVWIRV